MNNKKIFLIILTLILFSAIGRCGWLYYQINYNDSLVIGVIADIHAGNQEKREDGREPENIIVPKNFEKNLNFVFSDLEEADFFLTLGDNLNRPSEKYNTIVKELGKKNKILWTKGNHDKRSLFSELQKDAYYSFDRGHWRFIILDNTESPPGVTHDDVNTHGLMEESQLNWLKERLRTDKKVLIAMHVPMFSRDNLDIVREDYQEFQRIITSAGNVKYVLAGHYHIVNWDKEIDGIHYYIIPSISLKDHEGYYLELRLPNK